MFWGRFPLSTVGLCSPFRSVALARYPALATALDGANVAGRFACLIMTAERTPGYRRRGGALTGLLCWGGAGGRANHRALDADDTGAALTPGVKARPRLAKIEEAEPPL
jgi:hypothetical protein